MKKILVIFMVIMILSTFLAGCKNDKVESNNLNNNESKNDSEKVDNTNDEDVQNQSESDNEEVDLEPLELTIGFADEANAPFNEEWAYIKAIEEKFNVKLSFNVTPSDQYKQKSTIMINTGTAPDIIMFVQDFALDFSESGAIIKTNDYMDLLPNYSKVLSTKIDPLFKESFSTENGDLFEFLGYTPVSTLMGSYILRKDIAKEYGFENIETVEELAKLLEAYKAKNPDSLPLTGDTFPAMLYLGSRSWGIDGGYAAQYFGGASQDFENVGEFFYGYTSDGAKAMVTYFHDLYINGLMDPEIFTQSTEQTVQKMMMGKSIATISWSAVAKAIDSNGKNMIGEDFEVGMILPLTSEISPEYKQASNVKTSGWIVPSKVVQREDFNRILKFIDDYLYSEEGMIMQNYGIEGVTYEMVEGTPVFIKDALMNKDSWNKELGVNNKNFVLMKNEEAVYAMMNEKDKELNKAYNEAEMPFVGSGTFVVPENEKESYGMLSQNLISEADKNIQRFILDTRPLDEWDNYVDEMNNLGVPKLIEKLNMFSKVKE